MGIFNRLNQVIKSNLNGMLDAAEDPEKMISQTVVDMEAELKRAKKELVTTLGTAKRLAKKADELDEETRRWEDKAVLALRNGDEQLAREALRFKMKSQQEAQDARNNAGSQETAADEMKSTLDAVERKIEELKSRKASLAAQVRQARKVPGEAGSRFGGGSAFDELDRMAGRIEQLDAEVEAHSVIDDPQRAVVDAKFRELERGTKRGAVDDELAALKKKLEG
jgi:phage shock protein A